MPKKNTRSKIQTITLLLYQNLFYIAFSNLKYSMNKISLFILLFSAAFNLYSQGYEITRYTVEDGLMNNDINGVFQDSLGVIWVANGLGLTKFYGDKAVMLEGDRLDLTRQKKIIDGENYFGLSIINDNKIRKFKYKYADSQWPTYSEFFVVNNPPTLDYQGYYWSYGKNDEGEFYFIRTTGKDTVDLLPVINDLNIQFNNHFDYKVYEFHNIIKNFVEDNNQQMWIKDKAHKIYKYNFEKNTFKNYPYKIPFLNFVHEYDSLNLITVGFDTSSFSWGIFFIEQGQSKFIETNGVPSLISVTEGSPTYIIDNEGLKILKNEKLIPLKYGNFSNLKLNKDDEVFFTETNNDSSIVHKYNGTYFEEVVSFPYKANQLFIDESDEIWISSSDGLYHIKKSNISVQNIGAKEGYQHDLKHIYRTNSGIDLFAGTSESNQSIYFFKNNQLTKLIDNIRVFSFYNFGGLHEMYDITEDSKGNIYLGALSQEQSWKYSRVAYYPFGGIYKIDKNMGVSLIEGSDKLTEEENRKLNEFQLRVYDDQVFLLNNAGIYTFKNNRLKKIDLPDLGQSNLVFPECTNTSFQIVRFQNDNLETIDLQKFDLKSFEISEFLPEIEDSLIEGLIIQKINENDWVSAFNRTFIWSIDDQIGYYRIPEEREFYSILKSIYCRNNLFFINNSEFNNSFSLIKFNLNDSSITAYDELDGQGDLIISPDSQYIWAFDENTAQRFSIDELMQNDIKEILIWDQLEKYRYENIDTRSIDFVGDSVLRIFTNNSFINRKVKNKYKHPPPKIHFTSTRLKYEEYDWSGVASRIDTFSGNIVPYNMQLAHDQNNLTFYYQGISHTNKQALVYFRKLVGQDEKFHEINAKSSNYSNLEPGIYTFQIYTQDEHGGKSEIIECNFTIATPFWETWWFISLVIISIVFSGYTTYQMRVRSLKLRQKGLEIKIDEATEEIRKKKDVIEEAHKEITDSIAYAKRIQAAILPPLKLVKEHLQNSFIIYKPKDVVAGDFYWMTPGNDKDDPIFFAAADCTGHGVPGAMVSVVCNNKLNRSVREFGLHEPGAILDKTRELVIGEFEKSENEVQDGMDIALCSLKGKQLKYAGANNPLWIIRRGEFDLKDFPENAALMQSEDKSLSLIEIKPNKQPIGKFYFPQPFATHTFNLEENDSVYLFSDGYVDQFGGERGKKFKSLNFKKLLLGIQDQDMQQQCESIDQTFEDWKNGLEQIDDVCVIGLTV